MAALHEAQRPRMLTMLAAGVWEPVLGVGVVYPLARREGGVYPLPRREGVCTPEVPRSCR